MNNKIFEKSRLLIVAKKLISISFKYWVFYGKLTTIDNWKIIYKILVVLPPNRFKARKLPII